VRSTISRDTTQNTPAVDLVNLSKLAAHRDDLPLNTDDGISSGFGPPPPPPPGFRPLASDFTPFVTHSRGKHICWLILWRRIGKLTEQVSSSLLNMTHHETLLYFYEQF
jgi:hypothetical protein